MENATSEKKVNIIIAAVVVVALVAMIMLEVAKVNRDNNTSRKGTTATSR